MKQFVPFALAAVNVLGGLADPSHRHNHHHLHHRHQGKHEPAKALDQRDTVVVDVAEPEAVAYVLDGHVIDPAQAAEGIEDGLYVVVGESNPPPVTSSSPSPSSAPGQFFELETATSAPAATPTTPSTQTTTPPKPNPNSNLNLPPTVPTTSQTHAVPAATPGPGPANSPPPTASGGASTECGPDRDFPSGQIRCDAGVPTDFGPIRVDWLGNEGWTSVQHVGDYQVGVAVSNIVEGIKGGCTVGSFCSYACPPGCQKTQWPESSQGLHGESIGGFYCSSSGFLELTRPSQPRPCAPGAGGVFVRNNLTTNVAVCRTDYPGSENMVIPLDTQPGQTYPLTNVDGRNYYRWEGKTTSAQYYVNLKGVPACDACLWTSPTYPTSAGNWAPVILGVGMDSAGITYMSIFPNTPTSTAMLNFNVEITGDVSSQCYLQNGVYAGGGHGCTTALTSGGTAIIVFSD